MDDNLEYENLDSTDVYTGRESQVRIILTHYIIFSEEQLSFFVKDSVLKSTYRTTFIRILGFPGFLLILLNTSRYSKLSQITK